MKQYIIFILLAFILLLGFSANVLQKDIIVCDGVVPESAKVSNGVLPSAPCTFEHYKTDTVGYQKYQTFDEHLMQGMGKVSVEPFVWVKRIKDTIIVKSSSSIDSMRVYYKLPCGTWYNHMEYEMWKKDNYQITKSKWDKFARTYDRYFYNDTILEILDVFANTKESSSMAIVKVGKSVITIFPFDKTNFGAKLRSKIYCSIKENTGSTTRRFTIVEKQDSVFYVGDSDKYSFKKSSLGLWGIQPGIDETCIYAGQDIRNFTHSHPNGIVLDNDTAVYELADQMPKYPGGIKELSKIVQITVQRVSPTKEKRIRVVIECVVEKDGSLSNFKIFKKNYMEYDQKAIDIVRNIKRFTPAVLNGKNVRCKMLIPITFQFV